MILFSLMTCKVKSWVRVGQGGGWDSEGTSPFPYTLCPECSWDAQSGGNQFVTRSDKHEEEKKKRENIVELLLVFYVWLPLDF